MDVTVTLAVNGVTQTVTTHPDRPLLDVLREDLGLTGAKYGCGEGQCRACTVLEDDRPILSCITPIGKMDGKSITTIEGLAEDGKLHSVQSAFVEEEAMQCGYCTPGAIMQAVALLEKNPHPSDEEIVEGMTGNICRCCGYTRIVAAIRRASEVNP